MPIFANKSALLLAALCLGADAAQAQSAPLQYWIPGAFGGSSPAGAGTWRNFPGFDAAALRDDGTDWRDAVPTGAFIRGQSGSVGWSGLGQAAGFGQFGALSYNSTQAGYTFKGIGQLPVTVYAGVDSFNAGSGLASMQTPFAGTSPSALGYTAQAGIAFQPTPNISVSFEAGMVQPGAGRLDSDIRSPLLPGETPIFIGRR